MIAWIIHASSLPQMRGTGQAAVVLHRKCPVTMQMRLDRLGRRLKNADIKFPEFTGNEMNIVLGEKLYYLQIIMTLGKSVGIIYE
jgi:hypothetical protein